VSQQRGDDDDSSPVISRRGACAGHNCNRSHETCSDEGSGYGGEIRAVQGCQGQVHQVPDNRREGSGKSACRHCGKEDDFEEQLNQEHGEMPRCEVSVCEVWNARNEVP